MPNNKKNEVAWKPLPGGNGRPEGATGSSYGSGARGNTAQGGSKK